MHHSFVYTQLHDQTVLFRTIQFLLKSFVCIQFKSQTVLFDPLIRPLQVLSFWARVNSGTMLMKGYCDFPKSCSLLEPHYQIV